jgi:hypothetical protein
MTQAARLAASDPGFPVRDYESDAGQAPTAGPSGRAAIRCEQPKIESVRNRGKPGAGCRGHRESENLEF